MDFWDIVNRSMEAASSNADSKVLNEYQRRVKQAISIISLNLMDNQLMHIKICKGPTKAWKILCNIHKTKNLSDVFFICRKFFICKIQEDNDLLNHINKVNVLAT